jgi:hypothetical protein
LIQGTKREITLFAVELANKIKASWPAVKGGREVCGQRGEGYRWTFRRLPEYERENDAPKAGLETIFRGPWEGFLGHSATHVGIAACT